MDLFLPAFYLQTYLHFFFTNFRYMDTPNRFEEDQVMDSQDMFLGNDVSTNTVEEDEGISASE